MRLARLCELLSIAAETVERQKEISNRAQSNGKVDPPECGPPPDALLASVR